MSNEILQLGSSALSMTSQVTGIIANIVGIVTAFIPH